MLFLLYTDVTTLCDVACCMGVSITTGNVIINRYCNVILTKWCDCQHLIIKMKIQAVPRIHISMQRLIKAGWGEYMRQRDDEDVIDVFFMIVLITCAETHYGVETHNKTTFWYLANVNATRVCLVITHNITNTLHSRRISLPEIILLSSINIFVWTESFILWLLCSSDSAVDWKKRSNVKHWT